MILKIFKDMAPVPTCGILMVLLVSCVLFGIQTYFNLTQGFLSVGASVFQNGRLHALVTYSFYHQTLAQLLLNIITLSLLGSSLEKGFGTLRFLFLFLLLPTITGLCYSFLDLLQSDSDRSHTEGLLPMALTCVAITTMHTKMTRGFLCGVSFPTMALPWVLLIITTALVPRSVLPCNIVAILVGCMYGKGLLSLVDLSEDRAGVLEKTLPIRLLKKVSGVMFVPALTEERRKTILPQINPTPGSYPVQAYAPLSSVNTAKFYEGWSNSTGALSSPTQSLSAANHGHGSEQTLAHSCDHSHGHSHGHGHDHGHSHSHGHSHGH